MDVSYNLIVKNTISVIIPIYNAKDYLTCCIESLYALGCRNPQIGIELILIDDGSNDGSKEICDKYLCDTRNQESFSVIVIHQKNTGVSCARNKGLDLASGNWIWFVDADDYVEIIDFEIPNSDLIMFGCKWIQDGIAEINYVHVDDVNTPKSLFLQSHSSFLNQTMLFRRDLIERYKIRFTEGMRMGEDLEFQYKYLMICQLPISFSKIIYNYRVLEGSATNNINSRRNIVNDSTLFFLNILKFILDNNVREDVWLSSRLIRQMKTMLYSAGQVAECPVKELQQEVRKIFDNYRYVGYRWMNVLSLKLAYYNVSVYIWLNKLYIRVKRLS